MLRVLLLSIFLVYTDAVNTLSYCGQPKTWVDAKRHCEQKGGRLMNRSPEADVTFLERPDIPQMTHIWFGQYRGLSGWMEKIGCFSERSLGVSWYSIDTQSNTAGTCQTLCSQSSYFALQGSSCLCSYNNYVNISWLTPETNCIKECPGNSTEKCGGVGSMSVYHKVPSDKIGYELYPHLECAMMSCSSSTNWTYWERDCRENLTALCGSGVLVNQPGTWHEAHAYCNTYNSLIGLSNMVPTCSISDAVKKEFWIGVYRSKVDYMLKDRSVQNPVLGCYSIYKQSKKADPIVQFYSIEICDKQNTYPFICELPPGSESVDGCYLPPTTPLPTTTSTAGPLPLTQDDDDGLEIGLYTALCVVLLVAIIIVLVLIARKLSNPQRLGRGDIMAAVLSNIRKRKKEEEVQPPSDQNGQEPQMVQTEDTKPEYAVVNKPKPSRRASAPAPSYRAYDSPVTALEITMENANSGNGVSNGSYDTLDKSYVQYRSESPNPKPEKPPKPSILKKSESNHSLGGEPTSRHVTIDEGNEENCGTLKKNSRTLSVPKKVIPVPPPVVKYPLEQNGKHYEQIGTTLL